MKIKDFVQIVKEAGACEDEFKKLVRWAKKNPQGTASEFLRWYAAGAYGDEASWAFRKLLEYAPGEDQRDIFKRFMLANNLNDVCSDYCMTCNSIQYKNEMFEALAQAYE